MADNVGTDRSANRFCTVSCRHITTVSYSIFYQFNTDTNPLGKLLFYTSRASTSCYRTHPPTRSLAFASAVLWRPRSKPAKIRRSSTLTRLAYGVLVPRLTQQAPCRAQEEDHTEPTACVWCACACVRVCVSTTTAAQHTCTGWVLVHTARYLPIALSAPASLRLDANLSLLTTLLSTLLFRFFLSSTHLAIYCFLDRRRYACCSTRDPVFVPPLSTASS